MSQPPPHDPGSDPPSPTPSGGPRPRSLAPTRIAEALCVVVVLLDVLLLLSFGPGRDQGIYTLVGARWLEGATPYLGTWDFKPPGIFLLYGLAAALGGEGWEAPRLLEAALLLVSAAGITRLGQRAEGSLLVGLAAAALACTMYVSLDFWHTGQPESFGGAFVVAALVFAEAPTLPRRPGLAALLVGVLAGCAFLLKPPLGGVAVPAVIALAARSGGRAPGVVLAGLAGSALVLGGSCAWFAVAGAWDALSWTFFEFTPGYSGMLHETDPLPVLVWSAAQKLLWMNSLYTLGVLGLLVPARSAEAVGTVGRLLVTLALLVVGVALQGKFIRYHYGAAIPLASLLAVIGAARITRRAAAWRPWAGVLVGLVLLWAATGLHVDKVAEEGNFWERSAERLRTLLPAEARRASTVRLSAAYDVRLAELSELAARLRAVSGEGEPLFIWGFEPIVYRLADRPPASRFVYNVPQRAAWGGERPRAELLADLAAHPPAAVVVERGDRFSWVTGNNQDSLEALEGFPELRRWMVDGYRPDVEVGRFLVMVRADR